MDVKRLFINMGILGLCIFSIMAFIITTQTDSNVATPITNNTLISSTYRDINSSLLSAQSQTQGASNTFSNVTPTQAYGELEVTSIISPTKIVRTIIVGLWNIYIKVPMVVLGVSPVVAGLISSIIIILVIIGIWAIWKGVIPQ